MDFSSLAIGLANGSVILLRRFKESVRQSEQLKPFNLIVDVKEPITGLLFSSSDDVLFISTPSCLLVSNIKTRSNRTAAPLDDLGCRLNCLQESPIASASLVLAREEALYLYGMEGRRATYAFEGVKLFIRRFRNYLVLCMNSRASPDANSITIIDLNFKFVAYKSDLHQGVVDVVMCDSKMFIFCNDGKVSEKSIPTQS